ncbi:hypothetical protein ACFLSJ_01810 [Verrucomicrobiota bacterium]
MRGTLVLVHAGIFGDTSGQRANALSGRWIGGIDEVEMKMDRRIEELENGAVVYQVTDEPTLKDNIYCERSYCSPDSRWFIYQRTVGPDDPTPRHAMAEYVACEFGTWRTRVLDRGASYPEVSRKGTLFHACPRPDGTRDVVRTDIATGRSEVVPIDGGVRPLTGMTISPDERLLAYGVELGYAPQMFGIEVADLQTGRRRVVCRDPCICNPHPQFDQCDGRNILVQHNRGCRFSPDGERLSAIGPEGCTLFLARTDGSGTVPLSVGLPHTANCTGHEQWIGDTREVLLTVGQAAQEAGTGGDLLAVQEGGEARIVARGYGFNHVHASVCGSFFCADRRGTGEIVVGSIRTGKWSVLCNSGIPLPRDEQYGQSAHAHPYLSPDAKWAVYNSCRTGRPEIHVSSVPSAFLNDLT